LTTAGAAMMGLVCGWWSTPLVTTRWRIERIALAALMLILVALEIAWMATSIAIYGMLIGYGFAIFAHSLFRIWIAAQRENAGVTR